MPVGMFKPEAKTDTVNPAGTVMSAPLPGAKRAVSAGQSGLATTAAAASFGAIKPAPTRARVIRDNRREPDFIAVSFLDSQAPEPCEVKSFCWKVRLLKAGRAR